MLQDAYASVDTGEGGIDPAAVLVITDAKEDAKIKDFTKLQTVNISVTDGEKQIQTQGKITVRLLVDEEYRDYDNLRVFGYDSDGKLTDLNAERDGDYLVFSTYGLSDFFVVTPTDYTGWIIGVVVGAVVVLALAAGLVVMIVKKREA